MLITFSAVMAMPFLFCQLVRYNIQSEISVNESSGCGSSFKAFHFERRVSQWALKEFETSIGQLCLMYIQLA
jgi:hypothetical protein